MELKRLLVAGAALAGVGALAAKLILEKRDAGEPAAQRYDWDSYRLPGGQSFTVRACGSEDLDWLVPFVSDCAGAGMKEGMAAAASTCLARGTCFAAFLNGRPAAFAGSVPCRPMPPEAEYLLDPGSPLAAGTNRGAELKPELDRLLPESGLAYVPCLYLRDGMLTANYTGLGSYLLRKLVESLDCGHVAGIAADAATRDMYVRAGFRMAWEQDGTALYVDA